MRAVVTMLSDFFAEIRDLDCKPHTIQFEIDGLTYTRTKLPCGDGLDLLPRVVALLGNGLASMLTTGSDDLSDLGIDVLVAVAERAMRDGLEPVCRTLLARTKCDKLRPDGAKGGDVLPVFDAHFSGEYVHLLKVCIFALAHEYRGFTLGAR